MSVLELQARRPSNRTDAGVMVPSTLSPAFCLSTFSLVIC